jgi:hypothetical protein
MPMSPPLDYGGPVDWPFEPFLSSAIEGSIIDRFAAIAREYSSRVAFNDRARQLTDAELPVLVDRIAAATVVASVGAWAPSRNDQQIKLRGHRSEFGEIEFALAGCDCVEDAAVVVRCGESGLPRAPAAYVESSPGGEELRPREQRQLLFFLLLLGRTSG